MKEEKKNKVNSLLTIVLVFLLIVASFLAGRIFGKRETGEEVKITTASSPTVVPNQAQPTFSPKKSAKPEVKFFVMSFCPYGNQAEDGLEPVYQLLKNEVAWQPRYIVSDKKKSCETNCPYRVYNADAQQRCKSAVEQKQVASLEECKKYFPYQSAEECLKQECASLKAGEWESLHGDQELNQDLREICAFKENNLDKWWKFLSLVNKNCTAQNADTCWSAYASQAGLNTQKIATCVSAKKTEYLLAEAAESKKYGASGSPTIFINGVLYNGGRAPEDYKKVICASFEKEPGECKKILGEESPPVAGGCN